MMDLTPLAGCGPFRREAPHLPTADLRPHPSMLVDTAIAARVLGLRARAAREAVARVAARVGRSVDVATGRRPRRAVTAQDFAAAYGLDVADVIAAGAQ